MRRIHETSVAMLLAIWLIEAAVVGIPNEILWALLPCCILAWVTGLVLIYRHRADPSILPVRSHVTHAIATGHVAFMAGALLHDVFAAHTAAAYIFWLLPMFAYIVPCLAWRYARHRQATPLVLDAVLLAMMLVLATDAFWGPGYNGHGPDPLTWRFASEGMLMFIPPAVLLAIVLWYIRRRRTLGAPRPMAVTVQSQ